MASQALDGPLLDANITADAYSPSVLVVDDDANCVSHCARMLDELGYRHYGATSARDALEQLGRDPTIQIILADMQMPSMDGFVLIEEARARVGDMRTIAAILLTETATAELAIKGQHVVSDDGGDGALGVLARDEEVGDAKAALAGLSVDPTEDDGEAKHLPILEHDQLATSSPVALDVRHQLSKAADALGRVVGLAGGVGQLGIEDVGPGGIGLGPGQVGLRCIEVRTGRGQIGLGL